MSRTIRRKAVRPDSWVTHDWEWKDGMLVKTRKKGKYLRKALSKFHSDKLVSMGQYPAGFRRALNRKLRSKQRMALHKVLKEQVDQVHVPKFVKNGLWEYW